MSLSVVAVLVGCIACGFPGTAYAAFRGSRGPPVSALEQWRSTQSLLSQLQNDDDVSDGLGDASRTSASTSLPHEQSSSGMLVTTGYWRIGKSKRGNKEESGAVYDKCMESVMSLNAPFSIYGDDAGIHAMQQARGAADLPFVSATEVASDDIGPCATRGAALHSGESQFTNSADVPSVALGCIWDGKAGLLARSARQQPGFEWYAWMDVCMGHGDIPFRHGNDPWPSADRLAALPRDRISVSSSQEDTCERCREGWTYCHCLAGTAFVVPSFMVEALSSNFSAKVEECFAAHEEPGRGEGSYVCLSDQVIMTKLYLDHPDSFVITSAGYGAVATSFLTTNNDDGTLALQEFIR